VPQTKRLLEFQERNHLQRVRYEVSSGGGVASWMRRGFSERDISHSVAYTDFSTTHFSIQRNIFAKIMLFQCRFTV
jgi:hypothetical protein